MTAKLRFLARSATALGIALTATGASAQTVISRTISTQPVETTVTQTPTGTIVTRRPVEGSVGASIVEPAAPAIVGAAPRRVDAITTQQVDERRMTTRQVSARRDTRTTRAVKRSTHAARTVARHAHLALSPRERHIVYQTIVEREVMPQQQVIVAPPAVAVPPAYPPRVAVPLAQAPVLAADETIIEPAAPVYTVGSVLPANVPLYAMPQNVALSVPATQTYSYAYLGGRAYLVDPRSGMIVADVTE
jgi:hypothetical protein